MATERRRETLKRRRAGLAAGAAIGATALFAPSAQAAGFEVNNPVDDPAGVCPVNCTLRAAATEANGNAEDDTITFASGVTSPIRLTQGAITLNSGNALTIEGPGRDALTITGDADDSGGGTAGDSRIFTVGGTGAVTISGLTMTEGYSSGSPGGAISASGAPLTIEDSAVTDSQVVGANGGGIYTTGPLTLVRSSVTGNTAGSGGGILANGELNISDSTIADNSAAAGGGIYTSNYTTLDNTEITGNHATSGNGGGIFASFYLTVSGSTLSGNDATGTGGAISQTGKYAPLEVSESVISGNSAASGGGVDIDPTVTTKYGSDPAKRAISSTTIAGNTATGDGGGLLVTTLNRGDRLTISRSTVSANHAGAGSFGGGIMFGGGAQPSRGDFGMTNSTISGNTAGTGAGVSFGNASGQQLLCDCGSIDLANSTIASNVAATLGGGIYLASYTDPNPPNGPTSATIPLTSTIVADNTAAGQAEDLDREDGSTGGGFDVSFSLVEKPGDAPLTQDPAGSGIVGADPLLGALANNGGKTQTQLPAPTSPAVDKGNAPARLGTDQRELARTVDGDPPNAAGGDGTDIGSVEIPNPPANPPPTPQPPAPAPPVVIPPKNAKPQAFIKTNALRAKKAKDRRATGIAVDDHKVAKVQIALVYKSGGNCQDLLASGLFSKVHRCGTPSTFITAKGTKKWTFALKGKLKHGYYVLYARAIDDAGAKQTSFGTKSRRPFRVK
jgi:hypothetical protein